LKLAFAKDYPLLFCIFLFVNAFLLVAFTEEVCKYFGFAMVTHPDFMSDEELQTAAENSVSDESDTGHQANDDSGYTAKYYPWSQPELHPTTPNLEKRGNIGSSITIAMVSVALGFACCENLIYIFVYNGNSISTGE